MPVAKHNIADKPLIKIGLNKPCRDWLTALNGYINYGPIVLFDCGGTHAVTMLRYGGQLPDPDNQFFLIPCIFHEQADVLLELPDKYLLLTKLIYLLDYQYASKGEWTPGQITGPYDDVTGKYNGANIVSQINWVYTYINPPPPDIAPMPAPAMGSTITVSGVNVTGTVTFTSNTDGSFNFQANINWDCENQSYCNFSFPVPHAAQGKTFVVTGFCSAQAIGAVVEPRPTDNTISNLVTSSWNSGNLDVNMTFQANNIH